MTKRVRVLLVEDEVVVSMLVEDMLEDLGFSVVGPAASIDEALSVLSRETPDCAILDVNIGGTYVYPVADALRSRSIPYAFATGYGTAALRKDDGAVPVLQKPFRTVELAKILDALVERSSPRA
jgi:CheY-like chemotaxis protein